MLNAIVASPAAKVLVGFVFRRHPHSARCCCLRSIDARGPGAEALNPKRFRIGASSIFGHIESVLNPTATPAARPSGGY